MRGGAVDTDTRRIWLLGPASSHRRRYLQSYFREMVVVPGRRGYFCRMECEHCDCRATDIYCSSACSCQDGGGHLCFDEDEKYLGCWSLAATLEELLRMARKVAFAMPEASQVAREVSSDEGQRLMGWPFDVPPERKHGERVTRWFLGEDGTLHLLQEHGDGTGAVGAQLRWQALEKGRPVPASGTAELPTSETVSRAMAGLLG